MSVQRKINKLISTKLGLREKRNKIIRQQLDGMEFSVFSNNCIGGVFLHDAGKRFNSPLVNLAMEGRSFITYLENPRAYLKPKFEFIKEPRIACPIGICGEIKVTFVHYKTEDEAIKKWIDRSQRIIWDDIYIIATGHDGLEQHELMERFNALPYENKIMFTHDDWPQYDWAKQVKSISKYKKMPPLTEFATMDGKRFYETAFDISAWIAESETKKIIIGKI